MAGRAFWTAAGAALSLGSTAAHASAIGWMFANATRVNAAAEAGREGYAPLWGLHFIALLPLGLLAIAGTLLAVSFFSRLRRHSYRWRAIAAAFGIALPSLWAWFREGVLLRGIDPGDELWTLAMPGAVAWALVLMPPLGLAGALAIRFGFWVADRRSRSAHLAARNRPM